MRELIFRSRRSEQGSAFIVALLVLLVLTVLGLSLALITQSELQIGNNERTVNRVFYGADAGFAVAIAKTSVKEDYTYTKFEFVDEAPNPFNLRTQVEVTPLVPISDGPCPMCEINAAGSYNDEHAKGRLNHAVTSRATRVGGGSDIPLGRKDISLMVDIFPIAVQAKNRTAVDVDVYTSNIKF